MGFLGMEAEGGNVIAMLMGEEENEAEPQQQRNLYSHEEFHDKE